MWVVKIGGSLESSPRLPELLALLAAQGRSKVVIVPGGGRFAERVREEQRVMGMDDTRAHHLAIRAMEQYGALLCGMERRLCPVADVAEITGASGADTVPVWFPAKVLENQADIPASWEVTSDSLALWFAEKINAEALVLVKSAPSAINDVRALAATGYLDKYFPEMMKKTAIRMIARIGINEQKTLQQALSIGTIPPNYGLSAAQRSLTHKSAG